MNNVLLNILVFLGFLGLYHVCFVAKTIKAIVSLRTDVMKVIVNGGSADIKVTILKEMDIKILQARVEQMKEVSTMITNAIAENVSIIEIKDEPVIDLPKPPASVENLTATKNT